MACLALAAACTNVPSRAVAAIPTHDFSAHVTRLLESTDDPVTTFNSAVYQYTGSDAYYCAGIDDLERARVAFIQAEADAYDSSLPTCSMAHTLDAFKAEKRDVIIKGADGSSSVIHVPSTSKQVALSPFRDKWIGADQKALDSILIDPRNRLVPVSKPKQLGLIIAPSVTTRKIRLDKSTGCLDSHDPFKSRICYDANRVGLIAQSRGLDMPFEVTSSTVADDLLIKIALADSTDRNRSLSKLDVGNAYTKGTRKRAPTYMALPDTIPMHDADGTLLCVEIGGTPLWGEAPAGREWQDTFTADLLADGWSPAENVPCCFTRRFVDGSDAYILIIVDDVLISEPHVPGERHPHACALHSQLEARYGKGEVRLEHEPTSFVGFTILRDRSRRAMTISMAAPIEAAAREHIPEYVAGASLKSLNIPEGKKLRDMIGSLAIMPADASKPRLTPQQRLTAAIIGKCRWYDKVSPATTHALHAVSCVVSRPPPEALLAAKAILACQYDLRHTGITFGGGGLSADSRLKGGIYADFKMSDGARAGLEAVADSTWAGDNVYALLLMYCGGCVAHLVKKMHLIVDSSMESEAVATGKCGEIVSYAREILRALGVPQRTPTFVGSDNKANALIAAGIAIPSRSRHCLRRYLTFLQRLKRGEVEIGHVPDVENPSDFLTKWVSRDKSADSLEYATNSRNVVRPADQHGHSV